ncbi:MAG TPA: hypothetical protein PK364_07085, partial [Synergistaceae bacterium]|nr:hypothetical protein [Synergistaceae bacterium]
GIQGPGASSSERIFERRSFFGSGGHFPKGGAASGFLISEKFSGRKVPGRKERKSTLCPSKKMRFPDIMGKQEN